MVKIVKMSKMMAETTIAQNPKRNVGQWKDTLAELKESQQGAKVTELTRGQVAALIRQAKVDGFTAIATDKYTAVVLSPPKPTKA